jgi:hypothetical protein
MKIEVIKANYQNRKHAKEIQKLLKKSLKRLTRMSRVAFGTSPYIFIIKELKH